MNDPASGGGEGLENPLGVHPSITNRTSAASRKVEWFARSGGVTFWVYVAVAGAPIAAFLATETAGWARFGWIVAMFGSGLFSGCVPHVRERLRVEERDATVESLRSDLKLAKLDVEGAEDREMEARAAASVTLNWAFSPVVSAVADLVSRSAKYDRDQQLKKIINLTCVAASHRLGGSDQTRSCFFNLVEEPIRSLVPNESYGRSGSARSHFVAGTPAGDAALSMVDAASEYFCRDVRVEPPPGWSDRGDRDYLTFISVSVAVRGKAYGMLTLDSPHPGDLTDHDREALQVLAGLLGIALAR